MKICALIPAYNEAEHVAQVVEGARLHVDAVVVIDDGSSDGTGERARQAGALCLHQNNCGKASALRLGLEYALRGDFTHVVTVDGDGQHAPEDIPTLVEVARRTGADLVIGTRTFERDQMPRARFYSNTIGSRVASAFAGQRILDSQSGFRLFRLEPMRGIRFRSLRYEFEMEAVIKLARAGARIEHAPIRTLYFDRQSRSKMKPIRDTIRICLWSVAFRFLGA